MDWPAELVAKDEVVVLVGIPRQCAFDKLRLPMLDKETDCLRVERDRTP